MHCKVDQCQFCISSKTWKGIKKKMEFYTFVQLKFIDCSSCRVGAERVRPRWRMTSSCSRVCCLEKKKNPDIEWNKENKLKNNIPHTLRDVSRRMRKLCWETHKGIYWIYFHCSSDNSWMCGVSNVCWSRSMKEAISLLFFFFLSLRRHNTPDRLVAFIRNKL